MNVSNDKIERFKATMKKEKDFLDEELSKETQIEVYVQAIYLGYLDASRTFKDQRKVEKDHSEVKVIAKKMKKYIVDDRDNYDSFFYGACDYLCKKYEMKFGQAQKIINMAFKYLFCIANAKLKNRFKKCHMPLDGIMFEWIYRNIKDDNKNLKKVDAWSKIDKGKEDNAGTYKYYKKHIDAYCKKEGKTPLQLDFENWVIMSQTLAAESFLKTFTEDELKQGMHTKLLKDIE